MRILNKQIEEGNFMKRICICLFWCLYSICTHAQTNYTLEKSISLKSVTAAAIDQKKHLYIADSDGNVVQYDSLGKRLLVFSPDKIGTVTAMAASQTMRLFVFYRDFQEYVMLNRFLDQTSRQKFEVEEIGFVRLATLASDNNLWVFDENDLSIKKYNPQVNKVIAKVALDLMLGNQPHEVIYLKEYQNLLYLVDKNSGIWVFDNLGNFKKKLVYKNIEWFTVVGKFMYIIQGQKVKQLSLYSASEQAKILKIDGKELLKSNSQPFLFITNNRLYHISNTQLNIYRGTQQK
ncbi:MAG TPA: hypothetical protein DCS93_33450 [Microscillaceae bacterium]|nr:hypothetical protein [Microscillaceae bacterium]